MHPTISVITICFNNLEELLITCASVDKQTVKPFEHLIIDGSTENEIKAYLENSLQPPYRKWLCEPDNGIADAFNKGIILAKGNIINMLNSADHYADEHTLDIVADTFKKNNNISWLHSKYRIFRGGVWVTIGKIFDSKKLYRGMRSIAHQSMFIKKQLHDTHGLFNTSLNIAMDYDFLCRIANEPFVFIEKVLIVFAPAGISSRNYLASLKQARKVYENYFGFSWKLIVWQLRLKLLYYILNTTPGKWLYKIKVSLKIENM